MPPQRANNVLMVAKQVGKVLVECGLRMDDPTEKLKRLKIPDKEIYPPSLEQLRKILDQVRNYRKSGEVDSADYIEFLAFAGCRHGQAKAFEWKHDEGDWLVFPGGVEGAKGSSGRRLPVSPPLRAILERMKAKCDGLLEGRIFKIATPRIALDNACERLGLAHCRIHDLRHFFTTYALECGVDVLTVAKWLGHKDGGKLVLKTYGHLRDEHSLASAAKLG